GDAEEPAAGAAPGRDPARGPLRAEAGPDRAGSGGPPLRGGGEARGLLVHGALRREHDPLRDRARKAAALALVRGANLRLRGGSSGGGREGGREHGRAACADDGARGAGRGREGRLRAGGGRSRHDRGHEDGIPPHRSRGRCRVRGAVRPGSARGAGGSARRAGAAEMKVRVTEVGPRDGLQNESRILATETKVRFVDALSEAGYEEIEVSAFVSTERFRPVVSAALEDSIPVRGYVSTAFWCPYEGKIAPERVVEVARELLELGVDEISIGDTIGKAVPSEVMALLDRLLDHVDQDRITMHFHDTYGTAIANVLASYDRGIAAFDSSAGGVGGCPFAPGASGNVATEDVIWALTRSGAT